MMNSCGGCLRCKPSLLKREHSYMVSEAANAQNSASVDDFDTSLCLRVDNEMGLGSRKVMKVVVETRVFALDAQSASL
jgi:hypothetical protein